LSAKAKKVYLNSLGCVRNLVDSEIMLGDLKAGGFGLTQDAAEADIIVVNTCGFIGSAIDESINTILSLAEYKKSGKCKRLIVAGCLPERFGGDIAASLPEVDAFLGTGAYNEIRAAVQGKNPMGACLLPTPESHPLQHAQTRRIPSTTGLAYLKIAEGCDRHCTYCIIPKLRGRLRSRPVDDIAAEARTLIDAGFKEIVIIGQDTYSYGTDLKPKGSLSALLERIALLSDQIRLRLLYGSPDMADDALIRTVAEFDPICSYFDIPVQHASPSVLKKMGRPYSTSDLVRLFDKIRAIIPDAAIRTTLLVGFPGETDKDFKLLLDFMQKVRFDHAGVFTYSDADDLASHGLKNHVPEKIARQRYEELMALQMGVSLDHNRDRVGKTYEVLIEQQMESGIYTGRTYFQAPEVDGVTYVESAGLAIGDFTSVQITDAYEYDLKGTAV
jgi:ribosomal protein S12 methylthiotransferase